MWAIFDALVCALCLMHHGYLPNDAKNKPREWPQYMHLDLKPQNGMTGFDFHTSMHADHVSPREQAARILLVRDPNVQGKAVLSKSMFRVD